MYTHITSKPSLRWRCHTAVKDPSPSNCKLNRIPCFKKQQAKPTACRAADDDEAPSVFGDWRQFRAKLVMQNSSGDSQVLRTSESNMKLLEIQDPGLAAEGVWAHETTHVERGCLLLATVQCPEILVNDGLEQAVVFLAEHGEGGSLGLILNQPTGQVLGNKPGGLRFQIANAPSALQQAFSDSRVYCGGWTAQSIIHIMHPHSGLANSVEVVPGVFLGGEATAADQVLAGKLSPERFKFFSGALVWEPGQLESEIKAGCWYTAACSRSLVLKSGLQLPTPLWREVMLLMGGKYVKVAEDACDGDEVSGE